MSLVGHSQVPQQVWELRGAWASNRRVVLTLSERCAVQRIEGRVDSVAVTGAFVIIDGWHVPTEDIVAIHRPHFSQKGVTGEIHADRAQARPRPRPGPAL